VPLIGRYLGFVLAHLLLLYAAGAVGSAITGDLVRIESSRRIAGATEWLAFRRLTLPAA
jgi:hypothetical protein